MLVRTLATFAPSSCSMARLISILFAFGRHLEHDRPAVLAQNRRLLGDERAADHVGELHAREHLLQLLERACASRRRGRRSTTSRRVTRAARPTNSTPACCAPTARASRRAAMSISTALPSTPSRFSISAAALVLISLDRQRVDDDQRAVLHLLRQRRAQGAALDLLRDARSRSCAAAGRTPCRRGATAELRI